MDIRLIRLNKHLKAITDRIDDLEPYLSICRDIPNIESLQWEMTDSFIKTIPTKYIKSNGAILQLELEKEYKDLVESYLSNLITFIEKCEKYGYPETHIDNLYEQAEKLQEIISISDDNRTTLPQKNTQSEIDFWLHIKENVRDNEGLRALIIEYVNGKKGAQLAHLIYALNELNLLVIDPVTTGMQKGIFKSLELLGAIGTYEAYSDALTTQKQPTARPKIDSLKEYIQTKLA